MSAFAPFADRIRFDVFTREYIVHDERAAANQFGTPHIAYPNQVHGNKVEIVREGNLGHLHCDALMTDTSNLALSVRFADCQNFLIFAPKHHVFGVIHAGWRGMSQKIIKEFYRTLQQEWNINPEDTYIFAGPSLCKKCADFTNPREELPPHLHAYIDGNCVDLRAAADHELQEIGVPTDHIERSIDCTRCHPDIYWSVRGGNCNEPTDALQRNLLVGVLSEVKS